MRTLLIRRIFMTVKEAQEEMNKLMKKYFPIIQEIKKVYLKETKGKYLNETGEKSSRKKEKEAEEEYFYKIFVKTKLMQLFHKPVVYNYYMRLGMKYLGRNINDEFKFVSGNPNISLTSNSILRDVISDKYEEVILYSIKNFNDSRDKDFSSYFNYLFKKRIYDRDIIKIAKEKNVSIYELFNLNGENDGKETLNKGVIKKIIEEYNLKKNGPEEYSASRDGVEHIIKTESIVLLLMKDVLSIKEANKEATGKKTKNEERYERIFAKMYTSDFCNMVYKSSSVYSEYFGTYYISKELLKHEKEIFDFMDLFFMDFFMLEKSRTIKSIVENEIKTEKQIGMPPERDTCLKLPIEQRVYKFYYNKNKNVAENELDGIKNIFESYRRVFGSIIKKYEKNHPNEKIYDKRHVKDFISRYLKGNYAGTPRSKNIKE